MVRRCSGYTLLELMITGAVAAVCIQAGLGLFEMVERNRRWAVSLEVQRLVGFARSEAVSRQRDVTLCAVNNEGLCQRDWEGLEVAVFTDLDNDRRLDEGEALLRVPWPQSRGRLRWRAALARPWLRYSALGSTYQNGSFVFCGKGLDAQLVISVNRGGRPYVADPAGYRCT